MKIINPITIPISTSDELKNVLEQENNYKYIYLENDITLTSGITINESKDNITINGTYQGKTYTYTAINSDQQADTIVASKTNKKITLKNINIINPNTYGVISTPLESTYNNVIVEYNNVRFNGTQLSFVPYGTTRVIDSTITIEKTNEYSSQEVCETNIIEIGGNTNITSTSESNVMFYFRSDTANPQVTFLPSSRVNISTEKKEFMNGTNKLDLTVMHDAEVNIITGNGFAITTYHGSRNITIEERATLNFIEKSHQRIPMWNIYGNLELKKDSNFYVINSYASTPSDNYNLYFRGTNQKITLDNPNNFVIYTKNSNVLYTTNPVEINLKTPRLNLWANSTDIATAGGIYDLPEYSCYKKDDLLEMNLTLTNDDTIINSHNLTEEELAKLPELTNLKFQSKKQFSIRETKINIHPITNTTSKISGHAQPFQDILISYSNVTEVVTADENGLFEHQLQNQISDNTNIEIIANTSTRFIYKTRNINTPYNGELTIHKVPSTIKYNLKPISTNPAILKKQESLTISVVDSRTTSTNWKLYISAKSQLISKNGYNLNNCLIFKKTDNEEIIVNETPTHIFTGEQNEGQPIETQISWSKEKGPLIKLGDNALEANEEYQTDIIWDIEE